MSASDRLRSAAWEGRLQEIDRFIDKDGAVVHLLVKEPAHAANEDEGRSGRKRYLKWTTLYQSCHAGELPVVKYLVEELRSDPKRVNANAEKLSPLHYACCGGHVDVVKYLIETCHCDTNCVDKNGRTPLHHACGNGHMEVVKYLIETCHCDANYACVDKNGWTPLHYACDNMEVVKYLIETCHCDPNCVDKNGLTPLQYACGNGHMEVVKYLIETCNCNPNHVDKNGLTPLYLSIIQGSMEAIKYLIETCHCDPMHIDRQGNTILHCACQERHMDVVKYLIESYNCNPNCVNKNGLTPLQYACSKGHMEVVKYLIETGHCDTNCVDKNGLTPLYYACGDGHMEVVKYLIETCHSDCNHVDKNGLTPLHSAIGSYITEALKHSNDSDTNYVDKNWLTSDRMDVVKYLIETCHSDTNCVDKNGLTPLHHACASNGHMELVKYLIETCHSDTNCVDKNGLTPLHYACANSHKEVVKYLIETCHSDTICVDKNGLTPLHHACGNCLKMVVKHLIESFHSDTSCVDKNGLTSLLPVYFGIGHMEVSKNLNETFHCDTNCVDKTPLHYFCNIGRMEVMKYLIETCHCDTNCVDKNGWTPLQYACFNSHMAVVKYLIETCHCDPNCVDKDGLTPLQYACGNGHMEVVKYLIETCHCNPNYKDRHRWTPLCTASEKGRLEVVKYLLHECHCDPNVSSRGWTPLLLASDHPAIARELVKAGAHTEPPPPPPVKVFIVGNPSTGKSSLTKALLTETSKLWVLLAPITGPHLVSVKQKTPGVIPYQFTSKKYGPVIIYDFAGQQEYYTSHAALLQNAIDASLCIIVVNLCDSEEDIKQKLKFWISYLENQCISITTKPHVIIVGSHSDVVRSRGEDPRAKVNMELLQMRKVFLISKFIQMDCRKANSHDIFHLSEILKKSCDALRKNIDLEHLRVVFTYLQDKFCDVSLVKFEEVLNDFGDANELHNDLSELNDRGEIVYLNGNEKWVILDKEALLSEVNGVLFAPEDFKQHCKLANATGVVPLSKLAHKFPQYNPEMLVQFLSYFEFCREIPNSEVLELINQENTPQSETTPECYLFFSGLITSDVPTGVWETNPQFSQFCGWMLQCCEAGQFLTSQFLQVILLRIAFSCALALDAPGSVDLPVLHRRCCIWKNGIYWGSRKGVEALVEIRDPPQNREVVVMLRCLSDQEVECARLRSTIIQMVLEVKANLCFMVPTEEFFLHPSQVREYPLKSPAEQDLISIREVSRAVVEGEMCVVGSNGRSVDMKELLLVEPYANLKADILQRLFSEETKKVVSNREFYSIAECIHYKKAIFLSILKVSQGQLENMIGREPPFSEFKAFYCLLQCWREDSASHTYQSLRETLDQFSVFAGRNPLVSH